MYIVLVVAVFAWLYAACAEFVAAFAWAYPLVAYVFVLFACKKAALA